VLFFVLSSRGLYEVVIDLDAGEETLCTKVDGHHAPLDREEINQARAALFKDPVYIKTVEDLKLPPGTTIVPQGWPFGSDHPDPAIRRVFFILYHRNPANDHPDSNHYAFPLPVVMFWDLWESKVTDVHWCYTGNEQDGMTLGTGPKEYPTQGCQGNDYEPSLNGVTVRTDLKPLHVTQPEGVSFKVTGQLIEWQKWRFRIGFKWVSALFLRISLTAVATGKGLHCTTCATTGAPCSTVSPSARCTCPTPIPDHPSISSRSLTLGTSVWVARPTVSRTVATASGR
jgi:primary-amine oxidase